MRHWGSMLGGDTQHREQLIAPYRDSACMAVGRPSRSKVNRPLAKQFRDIWKQHIFMRPDRSSPTTPQVACTPPTCSSRCIRGRHGLCRFLFSFTGREQPYATLFVWQRMQWMQMLMTDACSGRAS